MKISNETKVGALTSIAIVFLILGFNFLKGKSLFKHGTFIYAKFPDAKKILPSHEVWANGFRVGSVYEVSGTDDLKEYVVTIKLNKEYDIPSNSLAMIEEAMLNAPSILITLGDRKDYLESGDTILSMSNRGLLGSLQDKIGPLSDRLTVAASSLDTLIRNFNETLSPATRTNLQNTMANLQRISASMIVSSGSLQKMLNEQGDLAKSMSNVNAFTSNLADNNDKLNSTIDNLQRTTQNLSEADIKGTIAQLQGAVTKLDESIAKINSKDGSIGLLLNDKQFYNNLVNTSRSANVLLDDLRANPKRYVNISFSVFGRKKADGDFLKEPLPIPKNDTTGRR